MCELSNGHGVSDNFQLGDASQSPTEKSLYLFSCKLFPKAAPPTVEWVKVQCAWLKCGFEGQHLYADQASCQSSNFSSPEFRIRFSVALRLGLTREESGWKGVVPPSSSGFTLVQGSLQNILGRRIGTAHVCGANSWMKGGSSTWIYSLKDCWNEFHYYLSTLGNWKPWASWLFALLCQMVAIFREFGSQVV